MKLAKMKDGNLSAVVTAETGEAAERFKSEGYQKKWRNRVMAKTHNGLEEA